MVAGGVDRMKLDDDELAQDVGLVHLGLLRLTKSVERKVALPFTVEFWRVDK